MSMQRKKATASLTRRAVSPARMADQFLCVPSPTVCPKMKVLRHPRRAWYANRFVGPGILTRGKFEQWVTRDSRLSRCACQPSAGRERGRVV